MLGIPAIAISQQSRGARDGLPLRARVRLLDRGRLRRGAGAARRRGPAARGHAAQRQLPGGEPTRHRGDPPRQAALQRRDEAGRRGPRGRPAPVPDLRLRAVLRGRAGLRPLRDRQGAHLGHAGPLRPHRPAEPGPSAAVGLRRDARPRRDRGRRDDARRTPSGERGEGGQEARRGAAAADRPPRSPLLRPRRPGDLGSPTTTTCCASCRRSRRSDPELLTPRLADPAGRRGAAGQVQAGRAPRADALARQRPRRGRAAGLGAAGGAPARAARHLGPRDPLRDRAEGGRPGDLAHLRERGVHPRGDPRRRARRRGRDPEPADDQGDPAVDRGRPGAGRGARRGLPADRRLRPASTSSGPRTGSRPSPTRATPRRVPSASSTPTITASRPLSIWCYGVGGPEGLGARRATRSRSSGCASAASRSTTTSPSCTASTRWRSAAAGGRADASALDFEIDGVVVKVDDRGLQRELGVAGPRAALGRRLEVPADDRDDEAQQDRLERRRAPGTCCRSRCSSRSTSAASRSAPRPCTTRRTWRARTSARATRWS